jgi:hypothetical protein
VFAGVAGIAHLQQRQIALDPALGVGVTEQDDHADVLLAALHRIAQRAAARGDERRDAVELDERSQGDEELAEGERRAGSFEGRKRVDDEAVRLEFGDTLLNPQQVAFEAHRLRVDALERQAALGLVLLEVQAKGAGVAKELLADSSKTRKSERSP